MPLSPNPYAALKEASQYVRLFRGKTFVVKVGGDVLVDPKIRKALCAEKLFFLLSVPGLLKDVKKSSSLVPHATLDELAALEAKGVISGGMRPKVAAVKAALLGGAQSVHLVSGIVADALLAEVFTNEGSGTMIVANAPVA